MYFLFNFIRMLYIIKFILKRTFFVLTMGAAIVAHFTKNSRRVTRENAWVWRNELIYEVYFSAYKFITLTYAHYLSWKKHRIYTYYHHGVWVYFSECCTDLSMWSIIKFILYSALLMLTLVTSWTVCSTVYIMPKIINCQFFYDISCFVCFSYCKGSCAHVLIN